MNNNFERKFLKILFFKQFRPSIETRWTFVEFFFIVENCFSHLVLFVDFSKINDRYSSNSTRKFDWRNRKDLEQIFNFSYRKSFKEKCKFVDIDENYRFTGDNCRSEFIKNSLLTRCSRSTSKKKGNLDKKQLKIFSFSFMNVDAQNFSIFNYKRDFIGKVDGVFSWQSLN